jgi:hypothetical protein
VEVEDAKKMHSAQLQTIGLTGSTRMAHNYDDNNVNNASFGFQDQILQPRAAIGNPDVARRIKIAEWAETAGGTGF